jgi:hypothetical protein
VGDHPDCWFILALDGYGSHVNVYKNLEVLVDHKIWLVKEEADTSSACQSYDQSVAKTDKKIVRPIIDTVRKKLGVISQWHLIAICLEGLKNVPKEKWIELHIKVNMHPDHHVGLEEWLKCIDNAIETGERFFKEHINDMYDAMPAVWKNLTPELRHEVVSVIDQFYENAAPGNEVWSKANVLKLVKFAPLAQVPKLRASYFAAKRNGRIMVGGIDDSNSRDDTERPPAYEPFHLCTWKPRVLTARYVANHSDNETQVEYLNHISNFVAGQHWDKSETSMLAPSDHLDLAVMANQQPMLNPTTKDVIIGSILNDTMGEGERRSWPSDALSCCQETLPATHES